MENKKITILMTVTLALVAVLLVFNFVGFGAATPVSANIQTFDEDVIAVYGQGKISIQPDVAYITCGIENLDADPQQAQDYNAAQMDKVMDSIRNAGIDDADIQTMQYNVSQNYDYSNNERKVIGYRVTNTVRVRIKDIESAGDIIKAVYDAGANRFDGIQFDIIERQEAYIEALDTAMERALQKAEKMAANADRKITGIVSIQESGTNSSPYYSSLSNFAVADTVEMESYDGGSISSGEMEISATVNVVYRLD